MHFLADPSGPGTAEPSFQTQRQRWSEMRCSQHICSLSSRVTQIQGPPFLGFEWDQQSYYPRPRLSLVGPALPSFIQNLQEVEGGEERGAQ